MKRPTWGQMIVATLLFALVLCGIALAGVQYVAAQGNIGGTLPPALASPYPPPPTATPKAAYPPPPTSIVAPPPETSDIQLSLQAPTFARRGEPVRLAYTVSNAGPYPARGVTFMAVLPSGLRLWNVGAGSAWDCVIHNATGRSLNKPVTVTCWRDDFLMVGAGELVYLDADVVTSVLSRDMLAMRAIATARGVDWSPSFAEWLPGVE